MPPESVANPGTRREVTEDERQCQESVYMRDMLRYSGRGRGGFTMHYERRQCRNRPPSGSKYCWRHAPEHQQTRAVDA